MGKQAGSKTSESPAGRQQGSASGFSSSQSPGAQNVRETVESIVIAFVLAFLFRTFEAEAFVIPTGSMAPTLMGRHKDLHCTQCGHRFRASASEEYDETVVAMRSRGDRRAAQHDCLAGVCPMCRYAMPARPDLQPASVDLRLTGAIERAPSYNGDRILVNKYAYAFADPERWDVIVFKYPGNAQINYIKRLVGLPGETLQIWQGDLFRREEGAATAEILRKPIDKFLVMRQLVHDSDYEPTSLIKAGWPLRWSIEKGSESGWEESIDLTGKRTKIAFRSRATDDPAWLRYRHIVPTVQTWERLAATGSPRSGDAPPPPQLVTDFNAYNARVLRSDAAMRDKSRGMGSLVPQPTRMGIHWVSDLMVEVDVEVKSTAGELWLDLVEAGRHFQCHVDLATGEASLLIPGWDDFRPQAKTELRGPGSYRIGLAHYDDQLVLWVNDRMVPFEMPTTYDAEALFGQSDALTPATSPDESGDLAPAGVAAVGAEIEVSRLRVFRDIYYIADDWKRNRNGPVTDLEMREDQWRNLVFGDTLSNPEAWGIYGTRRRHQFQLEADQFFVMGDNSPESLDSRLWKGDGQSHVGRPGGAYLQRELLIGKALCVYWPHSWNRLPGLPVPFPMFPNFGDMRLVR